jgi:hypothetical protein
MASHLVVGWNELLSRRAQEEAQLHPPESSDLPKTMMLRQTKWLFVVRLVDKSKGSKN